MSRGRDMKVNFIVLGAQKSGTTFLCDIISQHPEIDFSTPKEPMFFIAHEEDWIADYNSYHEHFNTQDSRIKGEGSTVYSFSLNIPIAPKNSCI